MTPLLILRVHTDLRLGLGHVARALAIQRAWESLGGRALMAVSGDDRARRVARGRHPFREESLGCEVVDLGEDLHAPLPQALRDGGGVVLVDQWETTAAQMQALRPLRVALMEDEGDAHEAVDLLFQPFLEGVAWASAPARTVGGRKVPAWEAQVGGCRILRGSAFIVVSPLALEARPKREPEQPLTVRRLLVTFGGTDGPGLSQQAFNILADLIGSGRWAGACTLLAPKGVSGPVVPGLKVLEALPDLTLRLREFDAVWCAAGLTLCESLCLGIPAVAWGQNERQARMIADMALANGCMGLGVGAEADPRVVAEALAHWLGPEGQETRQEQVRDGRALVDGQGAARVARELWALAQA